MKRVCLLLIISVMKLQESTSKSTFRDWRAPTNNLTGNQWPWDWGVSTPQNFYDSLYYNHYAPITNFQVDIPDVPEIPTAEPVEGTNAGATTAVDELFKKIEDLQKDLAAQTKKTEDLEKEFDTELKKEVEAREAEVGKIKTEVNSIDGRLNKKEMKKAVCGFKKSLVFSSKDTTLSFDRVYDEVDSTSSEGTLEKNGYFKAGVAGIYFISVEAWVGLHKGEYFDGNLVLSTGSYANDGDFINSSNYYGDVIIAEQSSASRYVRMAAGETLRISLNPHHGSVDLHNAIMCVSLYSASG